MKKKKNRKCFEGGKDPNKRGQLIESKRKAFFT